MFARLALDAAGEGGDCCRQFGRLDRLGRILLIASRERRLPIFDPGVRGECERGHPSAMLGVERPDVANEIITIVFRHGDVADQDDSRVSPSPAYRSRCRRPWPWRRRMGLPRGRCARVAPRSEIRATTRVAFIDLPRMRAAVWLPPRLQAEVSLPRSAAVSRTLVRDLRRPRLSGAVTVPRSGPSSPSGDGLDASRQARADRARSGLANGLLG